MRNRYRPWFRDVRTLETISHENANRPWVPIAWDGDGRETGWQTTVTYKFWRNTINQAVADHLKA